ncbi:TerC family protein [Campylobacter hominis]|uniref:Protein YegH n=1 Tax=Campylobacter hominis (strain ATCC BAA-381 / DSM 21671 / CCUG 45161 / LMG 19568 / NCTC 13146 / CH001A) TaxID=360107 RepID=A7HZF7_CAMHC|nr:TerC family protein [Campylobacter hominis]ABS51748.1 protein YegH [Campylobacter hominis ATCC BAA-381]UAK85487.1 TerC family protein [Campylobacter hominis]SUW84197.1 protein YegH [Campylobacter hominis]
MFEWMYSPEAWISLATLTGLEIVLGIDNIIFIAILCGKLPVQQRAKARVLGLGLAMITRILLLLSIVWIMSLTKPLFSVFSQTFSGRDLVLITGGLFLLAKSTSEIHGDIVGEENKINAKTHSFFVTLIQIAILDIVFSLDSVITAVGMAEHLPVMILAVVVAVIIMMFASGVIAKFVDENPTIKILALSFLILVGVSLIGDGFKFHIPKGYIYFSMAFSLGVELINIKLRSKTRKAS